MHTTILSGPTGTELIRRGVRLPDRAWSADAVESAPEIISDIHADYAAAGATVHVACTFRTQPAIFPDEFARLTAAAVRLCRESVPSHHRVAGCLAPIADCYDPAASPPESRARPLHARMARALADAGVDLVVCETFPNPAEALIALDEALKVGLEAWFSLTPGPDGRLLSPEQVRAGAAAAIARGAAAVMVNCSPPQRTIDYVLALRTALNASTRRGVVIGASANAGDRSLGLGWSAWTGERCTTGDPTLDPPAARFADLAATWRDAGASILGGCCGTDPTHAAALARRLGVI